MEYPEFTPEELANEEWRPVVGYEAYYSVSTLGRVRRDAKGSGTQAGRILTPNLGNKGYLHVMLSVHGKVKRESTHKLVMIAFVGPAPNGKQINHIDFNRTNARLSNLEYVTSKENWEHSRANYLAGRPRGDAHFARRHPETRQGIRHGNAKLNDKKVLTIRSRLIAGESQSALGREYGVTPTTIRGIGSRRLWRHI